MTIERRLPEIFVLFVIIFSFRLRPDATISKREDVLLYNVYKILSELEFTVSLLMLAP